MVKKTLSLMLGTLFVLIVLVIALSIFNKSSDTVANEEEKVQQEKGQDEKEQEEPVDEEPVATGNDSEIAKSLGIDTTAWNMVLVNETHVLEKDVDIQLSTISDGIQVDARIYDKLMEFLEAGRAAGNGLFVCSGYRSVDYQTGLFENRISRWESSGLDHEAAVEAAATSVAVPGTSEHHLGLAVDIICNEYTTLDSGFGETSSGIWLKAHCAEYGFILRYPEDKTEVTGYVYEPWHFRYVGEEAATYIMEKGICFEEFWDEINGS